MLLLFPHTRKIRVKHKIKWGLESAVPMVCQQHTDRETEGSESITPVFGFKASIFFWILFSLMIIVLPYKKKKFKFCLSFPLVLSHLSSCLSPNRVWIQVFALQLVILQLLVEALASTECLVCPQSLEHYLITLYTPCLAYSLINVSGLKFRSSLRVSPGKQRSSY